MERIELPTLEYHRAYGCNISCQQCSHYSNFHFAGKLPTIDEADAAYSLWSHRLRPMRLALLGGEPLLNLAIIQHIQLARQRWAESELMLISNGFLLHRLPQLPDVLRETRCRLEVSQHGTHDAYLKRFRSMKQLAWRWRKQYRRLKIRIRRSHVGTLPPNPFIAPFDLPDEEPSYIPPDSSGGEGEGSSSEDPGPRPPWWPADWPWPTPPDESVVIEAPPPQPNIIIIWPRLPPDLPYHLPSGYHYPDNLPEGRPGTTTLTCPPSRCNTVTANRLGV